LRLAGHARLKRWLDTRVGQTEMVLMETETTGRTDHYAKFVVDTEIAPGTIVSATVLSHDGAQLSGRAAA